VPRYTDDIKVGWFVGGSAKNLILHAASKAHVDVIVNVSYNLVGRTVHFSATGSAEEIEDFLEIVGSIHKRRFFRY